MNNFIQELQDLCDKYNLYLVGCGNEDDTNLVILDVEEFDWSKRIDFDFNTRKYNQEFTS